MLYECAHFQLNRHEYTRANGMCQCPDLFSILCLMRIPWNRIRFVESPENIAINTKKLSQMTGKFEYVIEFSQFC